MISVIIVLTYSLISTYIIAYITDNIILKRFGKLTAIIYVILAVISFGLVGNTLFTLIILK
jgi:hypothetical protein